MDREFLTEKPTFCPKCGKSFHSVQPKYRSELMLMDMTINDWLVYTCQRCEYKHYSPCNDARDPDPTINPPEFDRA